VAGRGGAVLGRVDLLVGAVDADAQHLYADAAPVRDLVDGRPRDVLEVDRAGLPRMDGDRLHAGLSTRQCSCYSCAGGAGRLDGGDAASWGAARRGRGG